LAPALSTKIPAPYDSQRTGRAPRPGYLLAFTPVLHSWRLATRDQIVAGRGVDFNLTDVDEKAFFQTGEL